MSNSHSLTFVNGSIAKVIMAYIFAEEIAEGGIKNCPQPPNFLAMVSVSKRKILIYQFCFIFLDFLRHFFNNY